MLEEAHEPVPGVHVAEALVGERHELRDLVLEQRVDELLLVGEAAIDGADAYARAPGDLVERDGQAFLGERVARGFDDALAVALGIAPQGPVGGGGRGGHRKGKC